VKTLIRSTLLLLSLASLLPFASSAQNANQDANNANQAASNANPYTSYAVEIQAPDSVLQSIPKATMENALSIRGLKKVTTFPSITVSFTARDLVIIEESVKESVAAKKDTTGSDTTWYVQVLYSLKCEGKCYNAQKQLVYSASWGVGQSKFTSFQMPTRQEAEDYWKNNKESLKSNFIASIINPSLVAMGSRLEKLR
jgi:hypothetical protein